MASADTPDRQLPPGMLTLDEVVELYRFTPGNLRSRLAAGGFPGAYEVVTEKGRDWLIPFTALTQLGYPAPDRAMGDPGWAGDAGPARHEDGEAPEQAPPQSAREVLPRERQTVLPPLQQLQPEREELEEERAKLQRERDELEKECSKLDQKRAELERWRKRSNQQAGQWMAWARGFQEELAESWRKLQEERRELQAERRQLAAERAALRRQVDDRRLEPNASSADSQEPVRHLRPNGQEGLDPATEPGRAVPGD